VLHRAEPASVGVTFAQERHSELELAVYAGVTALVAATAGAVVAFAFFYRRRPDTEALWATGPGWYQFLLNKWYFDEAYDAVFVEPTLDLARAAAAADKRPTDEKEPRTRAFDFFTLDGTLNAIGQGLGVLGSSFRSAQTGRVRTYVAALALTAALMLGMLAVLTR
jgi:NADH-quinone oxidoreductase subunit L